MDIICKNCKQHFKGHYCSNCGQSSETHKLDFHFLLHDIQHGLLHFDKGMLYSAKQLFTRPGDTIREFIEGKRVKHFKPISLVIVLATLYGLLYHYFDINTIGDNSSNNQTDLSIDFKQINEWIATHFSWVTLASIPFYTLGTYIAFRHQGYNYIEYFILNTFKASQRLIVHLALLPLLYYYNETPHIRTVMKILYLIDIILIYWTNVQFFNKLTKTKALLLSIFSHLIFLITIMIILVSILLIVEK
ncbi:DUF3667 domain-containing protein [Flavobacterium hydatis]|uniref:DUF3667 domain-containing protein n=1 Tax=Flavobacterium hydatis TaxID=991 RepID=A0A086A2D0_FLAHY|nr:DUF3667 domain-containing protein [Flavobacterium hydatis]KFF10844.1 hypothetical protein IW20_20365 [Flavobacterium hydatis]OXA94517.1 hypothetical protein B0A62_09970 [Flavobacterium hydatis]